MHVLVFINYWTKKCAVKHWNTSPVDRGLKKSGMLSRVKWASQLFPVWALDTRYLSPVVRLELLWTTALLFLWGRGGGAAAHRRICLLIHEVSRAHTMTHHSRKVSSGRVISPSQRPLSDNKTVITSNIHASGGIRVHNLSRQAVTDLRPRPRGHWQQRYRRTLFACLLFSRNNVDTK